VSSARADVWGAIPEVSREAGVKFPGRAWREAGAPSIAGEDDDEGAPGKWHRTWLLLWLGLVRKRVQGFSDESKAKSTSGRTIRSTMDFCQTNPKMLLGRGDVDVHRDGRSNGLASAGRLKALKFV
jgi:hypothetical protein